MSEKSKRQKIELLIQKGIREYEDDVVKAITSALDTCQYPKKHEKNSLDASQFRNVVRVASETDSPEVVKVFLRYQIGRDKKWGRGKGSLAEQIIQDIDSPLKKFSDDIVSDIQGIEKEEKIRVRMELIRRYLGYGSRYLKYLTDGKEG